MFGWLFTNALAAMGVCYGWLNPFFGLMVYVAFAVLRPAWLWFWAFDAYNAPRYSLYIGIAVLIGWLLRSFGESGGLRHVKLPVFGLLLYLGSGLFGWRFLATDPGYAWESLVTQLKIGMMAIVMLTLVRSPKQIKTFAWVLLLTMGYLAFEFNMQYLFQGYNRIYWNGFGGIDNNGVAMMMTMTVPVAFFLGIHTKRWLLRGLCLFITACLVHVILFSFSRGGQLGLCIVGFCLFCIALFKLPRKGLTITLAIGFVFLALHLAGPEVRERFMTIFADSGERDASAASRFDTWGAAWKCMKENPLGVGPRNFNLVSQQYGLDVNKSVHNLMLQTGADYGVLGMMGLFIFYVSTVLKTYAMAATPTAASMGWPRYFGHMCCISLTGFLFCSIFIGMESVELGFLVSTLGLCAVNHVRQIIEEERLRQRAEDARAEGWDAEYYDDVPMGTLPA